MVARLKPKSKQPPSAERPQAPVRGYSAKKQLAFDLKATITQGTAAKVYYREQDSHSPDRDVRRYYLGAIQIGFVRKIDGEPWELFLIDDQSAKGAEKYKTEEAVHNRFRELLVA